MGFNFPLLEARDFHPEVTRLDAWRLLTEGTSTLTGAWEEVCPCWGWALWLLPVWTRWNCHLCTGNFMWYNLHPGYSRQNILMSDIFTASEQERDNAWPSSRLMLSLCSCPYKAPGFECSPRPSGLGQLLHISDDSGPICSVKTLLLMPSRAQSFQHTPVPCTLLRHTRFCATHTHRTTHASVPHTHTPCTRSAVSLSA